MARTCRPGHCHALTLPAGEQPGQEGRHHPREPQAAGDPVSPITNIGPGHTHRDDVRPKGCEPSVGEEERLEGQGDACDDDGKPRTDQDRGKARPAGM